MGELDPKILEEAFSNALKSALGGAGPSGVNPRTTFHNKFQREMEEHDQDLEKKYDEDLNTTLIFAGLFSAVTSAFIIDIQSELGPDYEQMNNVLLEMLFNATTGTLPAGSAVSIPRWSGPDPVVVQVQCVFYATLSATLLAAFLAMLGKQWLTQYKRNETRGSIADRSRVRERKLTGLRAWRFHTVMESLPLILQFALVLLGSALSRYLWEVNRSVSSTVIGFICFGFLFYVFIVTASVFSSNCPFQTPFSLLIRFAIDLVTTHWLKPGQPTMHTQHPPQPQLPRPPSPADATGQGDEPAASTTIQFPLPFFIQHKDLEGDRLDARCIELLFETSTDTDVIISIMDFIPEITWHSGIKSAPLKRIYDILIGCFDFSGTHPVVIPKSRDLAYLSAKAFVHIELQRRCITEYEEQDSWKLLCANHRPLSLTDHDFNTDLETALFMVDMTLRHRDNASPWEKSAGRMTPSHHAWMSLMFLYHAWHMGQVSAGVKGFVLDSLSLESPSDTVITNCFSIIGLMIGVSTHVSDLTVKDRSRQKKSVIRKVFGALATIFSSESIQMPSASDALLFATRLRSTLDICVVSYELFKAIMAPDHLTDQHWEAARVAIQGAFEPWPETLGEPKEVLKFLDYHVALPGARKDYEPAINSAMQAIILLPAMEQIDPMTLECVRNFNWTSSSFVKGIRSMMQSHNSLSLRRHVFALVAFVSDRWFNSSQPVMEPEEMHEFCEHMAVFTDSTGHGPHIKGESITVLFGMLQSREWRKHIAVGSWSVLAYCSQASHLESARWCLENENATDLLRFAKGLDHGEGLKWWCWTLWFHYDKLDATTRDEVKRTTSDILRDHGLSDLNLYLNLIQEEITKIRQEIGKLPENEKGWRYGKKMKAQSITLEGNYKQLAQIMEGRGMS